MSRASHREQQSPAGYVYLIHLQSRYHHAQHYLGWTLDVERRLDQHRAGQGSPLLRAASAAGIAYEVVRTWPGDRRLERRFHNYKNTPARLCPICRSAASMPATPPASLPGTAAH